jgi:predicted TIM-barrel fold metal-dependent hydrolase
MKIIDCHTHLGKNQHINFSAEDLLKSMDEAGIEQSLVFAGKLNDASNDWMLQSIAPYKDRLRGVAAAHPVLFANMSDLREESKKIVDWFGEEKIVACKFYTGYDHYYPDDNICRAYLENLHQAKCPAIFHSGDCLNSAHHSKLKFAHPLHIDEVAVDYPEMKFVIAHIGYPFQREAAEVCYKNANVFADISGFVYNEFKEKDKVHFKKVIDEFVEIAGSTDKLLFGTDAPISSQKSYINVVSEQGYLVWDNYKQVFNL